jgi:outer membrane lipoprotein carrier protein
MILKKGGASMLSNFLTRFLGAAAVAAALATPLCAVASDADDLRAKLSGLTAMSADFTVTVVKKDGSQNVSSGKLALKRPDRLILHTLDPDETVLWTRGEEICFFDPFVNQLSLYSKSQSADSPFLLLTSSDKKIWDRYEIKKTQNGFLLASKKPRDVVSLELTFDGSAVSSLKLAMKDGSVNTYALKAVRLEAPDSAFDVKIPEDAEVDDERGAK